MQPEMVPDRSEENSFSEALDRRAADRAWKKRRRVVFVGVALLIALLIANTALALSVRNLRGDVDEITGASVRTGGPRAESGVSAEDVAALEARVEEMERALRDGSEAPEDAASIDALREETAQLRRDVNQTLAHVRCTDRALRRLDASLRGLLTRDLEPESYVEGRPLPDCP